MVRKDRTIQKYLNDSDNHDDVVTKLEPDIVECEVKWALGSKDKSMDKIYSYQQMVLGILNIHIQINETRHRTYNINTHMHKLNNRSTCKVKIFKSSRKKTGKTL